MIPVPFRPNRGVDHPPPGVGLRNVWLYAPTAPLCVHNYVMGWPLLFSHLLCDYRLTEARHTKKHPVMGECTDTNKE